jgi:hypothetical protein
MTAKCQRTMHKYTRSSIVSGIPHQINPAILWSTRRFPSDKKNILTDVFITSPPDLAFRQAFCTSQWRQHPNHPTSLILKSHRFFFLIFKCCDLLIFQSHDCHTNPSTTSLNYSWIELVLQSSFV